MKALLVAALLGPAAYFVQDREPQPASEEPRELVAAPADVASAEAIVAAAYDVISGAAGEERDWDRFRSLFVPEHATLTTSTALRGGSRRLMQMSPEDYVGRAGPMLVRNGFFETGIAARTERFGDIAHVFSTYESRSTASSEPYARGINSFQLWNDGARWWILSILWCEESDGAPIPARYLPA